MCFISTNKQPIQYVINRHANKQLVRIGAYTKGLYTKLPSKANMHKFMKITSSDINSEVSLNCRLNLEMKNLMEPTHSHSQLVTY